MNVNIKIKDKEMDTDFTIADRAHLKYKVLIGKNTLRKMRVLIDPNKR